MSKISNKIRSAVAQLSQLYKPSLFFARSVLIASAAVTLSLVGARHLGILEPLELNAYDQMLRWRPDEKPDPRLLIVGITEADIQQLKQWPISDRKIAEILQKLQKMQPAVIGLDVLRDVPLGDGREELTKVLQKSDRIIGVCLVTDGVSDNPGSPPPPGMPENRVGFADFGIDPGGILRKALLFMKPPTIKGKSSVEKHLCNDNSQVLTSFNLLLTLRYLQKQKIYPQLASDQSLWLGKTKFKKLESNDGGYSNADARGYQILINYRSRQQVANQVRIMDVLEGKVSPSLVKDKIVLIGYTTETVRDLFYTPYSGRQQKNQFMPGIVVHAQVISQILSAVLDNRPLFWFWPKWAEILWISGWSIVGGTVASRMAHPVRLALTFGAMLSGCCAIGFGIFLLGGWVPVAAPALALILTGGSIVSADRFSKSGYGKVISDRVKQIFKVEIDQARKDEEVAEIIQSDFFKELQIKKDLLRINKKETSETAASDPQEITAVAAELPKAESEADEYLAQLQENAKKHKQRGTATASESDSKTEIAMRMAHPVRLALTFGAMVLGCCAIGFGIFLLGGWVPVAAPALALILTGGSIVSADRFSKSGYGKVIIDRVKQIFKVEIDQARKDEEVPEIIQSDFFRDLQIKKDLLRVSKKETSETAASDPQEITAVAAELPKAESEADEYLAQLQENAKKHKQRATATASESDSKTEIAIETSLRASSTETQLEEEFSDLQAKAKRMRQRRSEAKRIKDEKIDSLADQENLGGKED